MATCRHCRGSPHCGWHNGVVLRRDGRIQRRQSDKSLRKRTCICRRMRHTTRIPRAQALRIGFCRFLPHLRRPFFCASREAAQAANQDHSRSDTNPKRSEGKGGVPSLASGWYDRQSFGGRHLSPNRTFSAADRNVCPTATRRFQSGAGRWRRVSVQQWGTNPLARPWEDGARRKGTRRLPPGNAGRSRFHPAISSVPSRRRPYGIRRGFGVV